MREERIIQATEKKFLRAMMGKTKRDRIRNAHIREELRMEDIQNQIEGNKLRLFGHVKKWLMKEYQKITVNEDDWKKTQEHTTNTMARSRQEKHIKKRMILGEG
jgi:hypothetical protein